MVHRQELDAYLRDRLAVDRFEDYGPNGLKIEGRAPGWRGVCGPGQRCIDIDDPA